MSAETNKQQIIAEVLDVLERTGSHDDECAIYGKWKPGPCSCSISIHVDDILAHFDMTDPRKGPARG